MKALMTVEELIHALLKHEMDKFIYLDRNLNSSMYENIAIEEDKDGDLIFKVGMPSDL